MPDHELFLKYNYPETKELCLHFLTLVTAVLVFSLNFAEKVFDFKNSSKKKRLVVILGWWFFLLSIILCGVGLVYNSLAGGDAVYNQDKYHDLAQTAYKYIIIAGTSFIAGLAFIMISAIIARNSKSVEK